MKTCSRCQTERTLDRFSVSDFGKPVSPCKDCKSADSLKRHYAKAGKLDPALSEVGTDKINNENEYKKEIKCKSFFFYQHT